MPAVAASGPGWAALALCGQASAVLPEVTPAAKAAAEAAESWRKCRRETWSRHIVVLCYELSPRIVPAPGQSGALNCHSDSGVQRNSSCPIRRDPLLSF